MSNPDGGGQAELDSDVSVHDCDTPPSPALELAPPDMLEWVWRESDMFMDAIEGIQV
jgi:hypothetical protein